MPSYGLIIDDASPAFFFRGAWQDSTLRDGETSKYSSHTFHATDVPGANVTLTFNGTAVTVFGAKRDNHGSYQANVDGQGGVFDGYASPNTFQVSLFSDTNLSPSSEHILFLSDASTDANRPWFDVDHAVLTLGDGDSSTQSQDVALDDTHQNISYSDNWDSRDSTAPLASSYYKSTFHVTNQQGATATVNFYGNAIQLYGAVSNNHGPFSVALDGGLPIELTGQSFTFHAQVLLYQWSALSNGPHTVVITSTSSNSSEFFDLDKVIISRWETKSSGSSLSSTATDSQSTSGSSNSSTGLHHSNAGLIAGIVVGVIALIAIGGLLFYFFRRRAQRNSHTVQSSKSPRDAPALGPAARGPSPPYHAVRPSPSPPPLLAGSSSNPDVATAREMTQAYYAPQGAYVPPSAPAGSTGLPANRDDAAGAAVSFSSGPTSEFGGSSSSGGRPVMLPAGSSMGSIAKARDLEQAAALANPPQYDQIVNYHQETPASVRRPLPQRPA